MSALGDITSQRQNFANTATGYNGKGTQANKMGASTPSARAPNFIASGGPVTFPNITENNLANLANSVGGMSLQPPQFTATGKFTPQGSAGTADYNAMAYNQPQSVWPIHQHQMLYPGHAMMPGGPQEHSTLQQSPGMYSSLSSYGIPPGFPNYPHLVIDHSPTMPHYGNRVANNDIPSLATPRRDSISSNEPDLPGTPFAGYGIYDNGMTLMHRSPSTLFAHSGTPSPQQLAQHQYNLAQIGKSNPPSTIPVQLQLLLQQEPTIPRAIPAPSSPLKPLDRSLENKNGETNVYIRGLHPETTDDMLFDWGKRFGDIQSSKSIIDLKTNMCKGFGFIKYFNFDDAEKCIRGFHYLGYEVSFARESFYAKLKKFSDENNTNLYVSNIPRTFNEHELGAVFSPFKVCSSRILRDSNGNGRGVGFARFESREVCEQVIKAFNNKAVAKSGGEDHLIQIRYSDTNEQKLLKQQTAAGRQFRAAEYDLGVAQARGTIQTPQPLQDSPGNPDVYLRSK